MRRRIESEGGKRKRRKGRRKQRRKEGRKEKDIKNAKPKGKMEGGGIESERRKEKKENDKRSC